MASNNVDQQMRTYFLLNTATAGPRRHVVSDSRKEILDSQFFKEDKGGTVPIVTVIGGREAPTGPFSKKNIIVL